MNKKSDIIQRLLDDKHITVEEAMTLMTTDFIPVPTVPYNPPSTPINPFPPTNPIWCSTFSDKDTERSTDGWCH